MTPVEKSHCNYSLLLKTTPYNEDSVSKACETFNFFGIFITTSLISKHLH